MSGLFTVYLLKMGLEAKVFSTQLIQYAIQYAKEYGAKVISAFLIPHQNKNKFPPNEAEFSGRYSTYEKLGFKSDGQASDFYQRVELYI